MKKLIRICLMIFFGASVLLSKAGAQNFLVEIQHAETFQPVSDVSVELVSESFRFTFTSNPFGIVTDNIPEGTYNISLHHPRFETYHLRNIRINAQQLNSFTFRLVPKPWVEENDIVEAKEESRGRVITPNRNLYFETGYQLGNIRGIQAGLGYYVIRDAWLQLSFAKSSQNYAGEFFIDPEKDYKVGFNKIWLGLGYDFNHPLNSKMGLYASPGLMFGMEMARNDGFIANEAINQMLTSCLAPNLTTGFYYTRFAVFLGANYSFWVFPPMNQDRFRLENGNNGNPVKWGDELFPGRKGLGFVAGIKLFF